MIVNVVVNYCSNVITVNAVKIYLNDITCNSKQTFILPHSVFRDAPDLNQ